MKTGNKCLVLAVVAGILYVPAMGEVELPVLEEKPSLISHPYPNLVDVEQLYVDIMARIIEPNKHVLIWKEIGTRVKRKIIEAGIKVANANEGGYTVKSLFIPQLRVDIDMIRIDNSKQYVFHIQTSLSRAVSLKKQHEPSYLFKADVWKAKSVMQAALVQDMPSAVTNLVLQQVEEFISVHRVADTQLGTSTDAANIDTTSVKVPKASLKISGAPVTAEYKYVASKNSKVFHKSECPSAKGIKPENLIGYDNRDDAIEKGKRPCKRCKP